MSLHHQSPKTPPKMTTIATMLVLGLFGGATANAVDLPSVSGAVSSFINNALSKANQNTSDAINITTSQTAMSPPAIQGAMTDSTNMKEVLAMSERQAYRIKDVIADYSFSQAATVDPKTGEPVRAIVGAGITSSMNCAAQAEKTMTLTKTEVKGAENFNASSRLAQLYTNDAGTKRRNRVARHLTNFCDITETASGICPLQVTGMGSADTDYSRLHSSDVLSADDVDASVAFTLNISDPLQSNIEGCNDPICNQVTAVNTAYQALSNVAQGAFVSQMNDRMYYEFKGGKAGADLGTDTNIKDASAGIGGSGATPDANAEEAVQPKDALYFGDSIADGYKNKALGMGVTNVGDNPEIVYKKLKEFTDAKPDALKGKTVVLSTGLSNNPKDYDSINKQMDLLKKQGANVVVLGVSNTYKGDAKQGTEMNNKLQAMSAEFGFKFNGGFKSSSDNVHPSAYDNLKLTAPKPQAEAPQATTDPKAKADAKSDAKADTKAKSDTKADTKAKSDAKAKDTTNK